MLLPFGSPRKSDESFSWLSNLRQITPTALLSGDSLAWETCAAMNENKNLAEQFLRDKSFLCPMIPILGFPPKSRACFGLFSQVLRMVDGNLGQYQAALIACIHLLPTPMARALLLSLKPTADQLDGTLLPTYLATILMARQANPIVCTSEEATAAVDLLDVVQWQGIDSFPPITRLLKAVGASACEDLLPLTLVEQVLTAWDYQRNFAQELLKLRFQCRWYEAERIVRGLASVLALPRVADMARDIFPNHKMWAAWQPRQYRIEQWRSPYLEPHRDALFYILKLEGPDSSNKYAATLGIAKYGKAQTRVDGPCHRTLRILDRCIQVGPGTVALLAALAADAPIPLIDSTHDLISAVVDASSDSASSALATFILAKTRLFSDEICPIAQMNLFSALIAVLTRHPHLQQRFIKPCDLAPQAACAMGIGASELRGTENPSELVTAIVGLAETILAAKWLHGAARSDAFLGMLPRVVDTRGVWPGKTTPPSQGYVGWLETAVKHGVVGTPKVSQAKPLLDGRKLPPDPLTCKKKKARKLVDGSDLARRAEEDQAQSGSSSARKERVVLGSRPDEDGGFLGAAVKEEEEEDEVRSEAPPATRGKEKTVTASERKETKEPGEPSGTVDEKMERSQKALARLSMEIQQKWEEMHAIVDYMLDVSKDGGLSQFEVLAKILEEKEEE